MESPKETVIGMREGNGKFRTAERRDSVANAMVNSASYLGQAPNTRTDILGAEAFCAMLALERRRAQRSRHPFILMLLDASDLEAERRKGGFNKQLVEIISSVVRESDIIGWYQRDQILGVIFTEIGVNENSSISEVVRCKVLETLRENIEPSVTAKMVISIHHFPEGWNRDRSEPIVDDKLYPDLPGTGGKKKVSIALKRAIDIVGSFCLLLVLSPVLAAIALAIKLTSKGPVIFRQERIGQSKRTFQCFKFRTMYQNNDPKIHREYVRSFIAGKVEESSEMEQSVYKITDDPRVTPVGRFLRRASLDELPQFWNVLMNEMSLVGPRPPLPYEFAEYDLWHQRRVLEVKPGVTGLWQVTGRSRTSFDEMVRMDLRYCQRWSLWLDFKILLATPSAVVKGSGAY